MSVTFIDALETLHSRHCPPTCECSIKERPVTPADLYGYREQLRAIVLSHEESDNGWHDIWCHESDDHHETFNGAVDEFVNGLVELGWAANARFALCPECQELPDTATYSSQFEDNRGLLG